MSTNPDIKVKKIFKIRRKKTQASASSSISDSSQDNKPRRKFKIKRKPTRDTSSQGVVSSEISSSLLNLLVTSSNTESVSSTIETKTALSNYSVNIIVPFRDNLVLKSKANQNRSEHLREFKEYMTTYFLPLVV